MLTDKYLKLQSVYFKLLGFNILASKDSWLHPGRSIFHILCVVTFLPLTLAFCLSNANNVQRLTDGLCSALIQLLALSKVGLILWRREDLARLIDRFRRMLSAECRISAYAQIIDEVNRREQLLSSWYKNCFVLAAMLACCLLPLLHLLSSLLGATQEEVQPGLPFPSVYPWSTRTVLNYSVSYVWNVAAAVGVVLPTICVDTLFCSLTHNLCALFRISQHKVQHFAVADTLGSSQASLVSLVSSIELHQRCLDIARTLNLFFRPLINIQFLVASLHLCVLGYQLATNLTEPEVLFYAAFTGSMLAQLYMYCYCGECVKTESVKFAWASYRSDWFEAKCNLPALGRLLQVAMIRAQRGTHIRGHFLEVNMETFLRIVNKSMSYVTLLRSISKEG